MKRRPLIVSAIAATLATTGTRRAKRPLVASALAGLLSRLSPNPCHMVVVVPNPCHMVVVE